MIKRRFLSILIATILTLSLMPMMVSAELEGFFIEDGIRYRILEDNTVEVTYDKEGVDPSSGNLQNSSYSGSITVPAQVTHNDITYSVIGIDGRAFYYATNLESITLPEGLKYIEGAAFQGSGITSITIPASVERIGNEGNSSNPVFPTSTNTSTTQFQSISFSDNSQLKTIGAGAFAGTSITSIAIPDGVKTIYPAAFENCEQLTSLEIPAQADLSITTSTYFADEKSLGALLGWPNLGSETLSFKEGSKYKVVDGVLYDTSTNSLIAALDESLTSVTVEEGTKTILDSAFLNSSNLANVNLPDGLETIGDNAFNLASNYGIPMPPNMPNLPSMPDLENTQLTDSLEFINIPASVTSVGDNFLKGGIKSDGSSVLLMQGETPPNFGDGALTGIGESGMKIYYPESAREAYGESKLGNYLPETEEKEESAQQNYGIVLANSITMYHYAGSQILNGATVYLPSSGGFSIEVSSDNLDILEASYNSETGNIEIICKGLGVANVKATIKMNNIEVASDSVVVTVEHNYVRGKCSICGKKDPSYVVPSRPQDPIKPGIPHIVDTATKAY